MKKLLPWFAAFLLLVVIFGTMYTVVQQSERRDANYPQIQLAEDTAAKLNQGADPKQLVGGTVDMAASLASFTIIYGKSGQVIGGSGYLHGKLPTIPYGVLAAAQGKDYHFVSWQPEPDVRIAAVSVAAKGYFVLSGRSLKEVEKNEAKTFQLSLLGGVIATLMLGAVYFLSEYTIPRL